MNRTQKYRLWWRTAFFLLFVLAPPLDLFRYDLTQAAQQGRRKLATIGTVIGIGYSSILWGLQ